MTITGKHRAGRHKADRRPLAGRNRVAIVAAGTTAAVMIGGTAFAYWTTSGTGSGAAAATSMSAPTITASTITAELYPGSTGGTLGVTATNPNPFPITVTLNPSTNVTGCTTPAVTFSGGSFTLAANASSVTKLVNNSVSMGSNASNDCQGQPLNVAVTTSSTTN